MKKKIFAIIFVFALVFSSAIFLSAENTYAEGEKTFIVTEKALGADDSTATDLGGFDTLHDAIAACKLGFHDSKEYVITLTKNYNVGINENVSTINNRNISFKSKGNNQFKITANTFNGRKRYMFAVDSNCKVKFENIVLDGNNQNPFIEIQDSSGVFSTVTIGSGTVIQNFKVMVEEGQSTSEPFIVNGNLIIEEGAIIQNNKNDSDKGYGIIYSTEGEITINGGLIKDNHSAKYGGLIMAFSKAKVNLNGGMFTGNQAGSQGGVIYSNGALTINGGTFEGNKARHSGGVVAVGSKANLNVSGGTFKENSAMYGSAIYTSKTQNAEIKNALIESNVSGFGAVYFNGGSANVENVTFNNNLAFNKGSALINRDADVTVTESTFKENGEMTDSDGTYTCSNGGAIAVEKVKNNDTKLTVKESTFDGNKAKIDGGAIHTSDSNYINKVDNTKDYKMLDIDNATVFKNNKASAYFNPPENISDLTNINAKETSFTGTKKIKPDSPLNNYDINYKRDIVVTYDPNNGEKVFEDKLENTPIKDYRIKSDKDLNFTSLDKFLGWAKDKNASKAEYKASDKIDLNGNLYLYAIWEKTPTPEPKPEPQPEPKPEPKPDVKNETEIKVHEYVETFPVFVQADPVKKVEEKINDTHIGYISGYPDNTVKADGNVTRAEAVTMLVRLKAYPLTEGEEIFKDVKANAWYAAFISAAYKNNILEEKKGEAFRPDEKITRGELAQLISHIDKKNNAKATFSDIVGHKYEAAINQSFGNKRISGYPDGTFKPDNAITRAETARILNSLFDRKVNEKGLSNVLDDLKIYKDLDKNHWAYYEIMEASYTHQCEKSEKNAIENWIKIVK